jgi:RNA recognition motif-containing protein
MATADEANAAIARLNGTDLDGRQIRVELSTPRATKGGPPPRRGGGGRDRW